MRLMLISIFVFCNVNCQLFEKSVHNRIKCIIGKTSKRSEWKVKTCPPYSSYCVTSEIGNLNEMLPNPIDTYFNSTQPFIEDRFEHRYCGGPTRRDLIGKYSSSNNQSRVKFISEFAYKTNN